MGAERLTFPIMLGGLVAAGAGIGALIALMSRGLPNNKPVQLPEPPPSQTAQANQSPYAQFQLADFILTDRDGQPADASIFDGKVTFLSFFFASCPGPCPIISAKMIELQRATEGSPVQLVSISVDGLRDTPQVISDYADGYSADPDRWHFLTGDPALVEALLAESLGFTLGRRPDEPVQAVDGSTISNIIHPTRIMLVGPDRRLLAAPVSATDADGVTEMMSEALRAAGS
ncbi:MAG: protein SCO1/2 [Phycisphaerales bacterium]|jgi:protein SCO1/2